MLCKTEITNVQKLHTVDERNKRGDKGTGICQVGKTCTINVQNLHTAKEMNQWEKVITDVKVTMCYDGNLVQLTCRN